MLQKYQHQIYSLRRLSSVDDIPRAAYCEYTIILSSIFACAVVYNNFYIFFFNIDTILSRLSFDIIHVQTLNVYLYLQHKGRVFTYIIQMTVLIRLDYLRKQYIRWIISSSTIVYGHNYI